MKVILMQVQDTASQLPSESGSAAWIWIILIAVVAVVGYFIWKGRQQKQLPPVPPPADTTTHTVTPPSKPKNK
jgi:heme/copper-type cytochrome/quinol oxidase subunit 2